MNWLDLTILVLLAIGAYRGYATGMIRQVTGIVGLVLAFLLAVQLMDEVGRVIRESLAVSETVAPILGFVLVFLVVRLLVMALVRLIESLLSALRLSAVNRLAGGAFGIFQAALLLSLAFLVLRPTNFPGPHARARAELYRPVAAVLPGAWSHARTYWPRLKDLSAQFGERVEEELFVE